jgi:hypothetical protein
MSQVYGFRIAYCGFSSLCLGRRKDFGSQGIARSRNKMTKHTDFQLAALPGQVLCKVDIVLHQRNRDLTVTMVHAGRDSPSFAVLQKHLT